MFRCFIYPLCAPKVVRKMLNTEKNLFVTATMTEATATTNATTTTINNVRIPFFLLVS